MADACALTWLFVPTAAGCITEVGALVPAAACCKARRRREKGAEACTRSLTDNKCSR